MLLLSACSINSNTSNLLPSPTSTTSVSSEVKTYTLADISQHAIETDCWMAVEGKVYNVTDFVGKHPGGKAILGGCGKDATILFNERPTNNKGPHPDEAREILKTFEIGTLAK